jgi:hypothetical protein
VRSVVAGPGADRYLAPDLARVEELVRSPGFLGSIGEAIGPLA